MTAVMSPRDYQRQFGGSNVVPLRSAERPAPNNITDGRFWGDDEWAGFFMPAAVSTADHAAKISAVYFCVSLIAEAVGSLPIDFIENGSPVENFGLADILSYAPNPMQTAAEFWPSMLYRAALAGYAFAEPVVTGDEIEIWPLHPDRQSVEWRERGFTLTYMGENGQQRTFNPSQLFWFSGLADARMQPLTPWKMAKGAIDFALALETQGRDFFQNSKKIPGVLSSEQKLSQEVVDRLKEGMAAWKSGKTPVLEQGLTYQAVASNNSDAQYVELLEQRTREMSRYWHIPTSFYEATGNAKSDEQQAQTLVKYTVRPWTRRIEQAIWLRLLTPDQRKRFRPKFNLDGLLRGDSATQWKNAVLARTASILSIDEIRTRWFGLPAIGADWAKDQRAPLNSNRAADTLTGGQSAPQDMQESDNG